MLVISIMVLAGHHTSLFQLGSVLIKGFRVSGNGSGSCCMCYCIVRAGSSSHTD